MNALQKKRLNFVLLMLFIASLSVGLSLYALKQNINLFYTPTQLAERHLTTDQLFRLGGKVKKGTVKQNQKQLLVSFVVKDATHSILVEYRGILPDLFREGQSVVVEGSLDQAGIMQAKQVLAKHDEQYRPVSTNTYH
jgi:cytochrome c-type biogenesis protein CcmE